MILDLRDLDDFPAEAVVRAERGEIAADFDEVLEIGATTLELAVQKSGEEYYCQGDLAAEVRLECVRCLSEFTCDVTGRADFIIRPGSPDAAASEGVVDDEDYVYLSGDDLRVDLSDIARQAVVLALPMKPICSEDCRGLCPVCGANRNTSSCDCKVAEVDERWEGLAGLSESSS